MKKCPHCGREYDASMMFCLDDGAELLYGPAPSDEPATAIFRDLPDSAGGESKGRKYLQTDSPGVWPRGQANIAGSSIAVLPFKNISPEPDNEYFCEGLAEELLNGLAKIGDLKVAARTSAFSFRDGKTEIGEIGRKLGVSTVLEGSVRKAGDRLRIAVQLLNASDGYHIWSETYDREMRNIFDVQDEITLAVIDALKVKLLGSAKDSILRRETENTEAYKSYLKGRYLRYAKNDHRGAALAFQEAIALDPLHAPSWVGIAETWILQSHYGLVLPLEACRKATEALERANRLQGESAEALYVDGFVAFVERNWARCFRSYGRAIDLDPDNSRVLGTFGIINCVLGRVDDGLRDFEIARHADALASYPYAMTGTGLVSAGLLEESMPYFEQAFSFEKDQALALWSYSIGCVGLERFDEGIAAAERAVLLSDRTGYFLGLLGWSLASAGRVDEAGSILQEIQDQPHHSSVSAWEACILGVLGESDLAFAALSRAIDDFSPFAYYLGLPCYDSLRGDPRFAEIISHLKLPENTL